MRESGNWYNAIDRYPPFVDACPARLLRELLEGRQPHPDRGAKGTIEFVMPHPNEQFNLWLCIVRLDGLGLVVMGQKGLEPLCAARGGNE